MTDLTLTNFPRSPMFIDPEKRIMSREWLDFLLAMFLRMGGQHPTIPDLRPLVANRIVATNADINFRSPSADTLWVLDKGSGSGIQVDLENPTFGWRDLKGKVTQRNTGVSKPTHAIYRDTLRQYQFGVGKEEYFTYHIDHDHLLKSDILLHIHWSHISAAVTGGTITLEYEISYSKGYSRGTFGASVSTTFLGTASATQFQKIISEVQISAASPDANQIDSNDLEPDGIIEARVKITANNMTGDQPDPFIHEADVHYQSTNIGTKERDFDFNR